MNVIFLIVDLWQSCVRFIRSGITRCTLLIVLSLYRMCQRGFHALLWSHIGTLMHRLAAEPCITAGLLFPSRCPSGTILLTPFSMVWDWFRWFQEQGQCFFAPKLLYPYYIYMHIYIYTTILPWSCTDGRYFYDISGTALFSGTNSVFFGTIVIFLLHFGYTCPNQEIGFKWK